MDNFAVITSYFNFTGNKHFLHNFKKFEESLAAQNIKLFAVEVSNGEFELPENENYLRLKTNSVLWHKESSLNTLVKTLPPEIEKVAWVDSDVIFKNKRWAKKVCTLLDKNKIVQVVGNCDFLYENKQIAFTQKTLGKAFVEGKKDYNRLDIYHLGLGWAVNRDFFDEVGLFDLDMVGGGDSITYFSCLGNVEELHPWKKRVIQDNSPDLWKEVEVYNKKCFDYMQGKVSYANNKATHLFHSFYDNKIYLERYKSLSGFKLTDIVRQENGLFEWNEEKNIEDKVKDYFKAKDCSVTVNLTKDKRHVAWGRIDKNFKNENERVFGKINLGTQPVFSSHRSGWAYAIDSLGSLHNDQGVRFDGFIEKEFAWHYEENVRDKKVIPYRDPWVGFVHNPPFSPRWFLGSNSLDHIIERKEWLDSMESCKGLFCLSKEMKTYLEQELNVPVCNLIHPTEIPETLFNYENFINNPYKKITMIGYWLRKLNSIYNLPLDRKSGYKKIRLLPYTHQAPRHTIKSLLMRERQEYKIEIDERFEKNTFTVNRLENDSYDKLLSENIIFLNLYATSANNAVIECIARGTPILINRLPSTEEYLGKDYPFFFDSLEEAAAKAMDYDLIKITNEYLINCETRKKLSSQYFKRQFALSDIYKSL